MEDGTYSFDEIIPRKGDGPSNRPDIISKYSHARLLKNSPTEIIVHGRYFPDFNNVEWDGVVDEYFKIAPNGMVVRPIRKGTKKFADWNDPGNVIYRTYQLSNSGIKTIFADKGQPKDRISFFQVNRTSFKEKTDKHS